LQFVSGKSDGEHFPEKLFLARAAKKWNYLAAKEKGQVNRNGPSKCPQTIMKSFYLLMVGAIDPRPPTSVVPTTQQQQQWEPQLQ